MYKVLVVLIMLSSWQAMGQDSLPKTRRIKKHKARSSQKAPATEPKRADSAILWKSPEAWKAQKK